ncbi:MAG TPA: sodium:solute symporter, partial [Cyclobacteriaceae bacterium]|nr:sodium:solute symporter [Cyclobacteriaceae bacterium]
LIGGLFLFLSYFGADQSQVGRYLSGSSVTESRMGLIFNGILKIPMQFIILYIGILVFVFYQFHQAPLFHNSALREKVLQTEGGAAIRDLETSYESVFVQRRNAAGALVQSIQKGDDGAKAKAKEDLKAVQQSESELRSKMKSVIKENVPGANTRDTDYVFINFVMTYLPHGLIGLLLAVVFSAAMSSMASELSALASTTAVDIYKRSIRPSKDDEHYLKASRWFTVFWAIAAMTFASLAEQAENLIQFVNIVGSLVYGTILGIFLSAFYLKYLKSTAVFWAAIGAELIILYLYFFQRENVAFLLYNIIGCIAVVIFAFVIQFMQNKNRPAL